jgi:hypothetical protein
MAEEFEVLSALLDGEPVDLDELEAALSSSSGRRTLLDFARLRNDAGAGDEAPRQEFLERVRRETTPSPRFFRRQVPLSAAVAAVILTALLASALNTGLFKRERPSSAPPEATRVLRFEPGVDWQTESR